MRRQVRVWLQAVEGVGISWSFVDDEEGRNIHSFVVRLMACLVSIGGMLVTALMLGIVSGASDSGHGPKPD